MKSPAHPQTRQARAPHLADRDRIPDDVRAELDHEELQLSASVLPAEGLGFVPEDVLAEQDAANRALVSERSDDAVRLAATGDDDSPNATG